MAQEKPRFAFPNVIAVEQLSERGRANLASNPKLVKQVLNHAVKGAINHEGKWDQNPGGPWPIEKLRTGTYKVSHNWGYYNLSLSVSMVDAGSVKIVECASTYFIVETYTNGRLTDAPFMFTLTKVISPR